MYNSFIIIKDFLELLYAINCPNKSCIGFHMIDDSEDVPKKRRVDSDFDGDLPEPSKEKVTLR